MGCELDPCLGIACEAGQFCRDGICVPSCAGVACNLDQACDDGEDCATCPADCGACCGDGACTPGHAEDCATCPADCGACGACNTITNAQCKPTEQCYPVVSGNPICSAPGTLATGKICN